ncbi:hypothetical protein ACWD4T_49180 [Streptomyces umbrinus]
MTVVQPLELLLGGIDVWLVILMLINGGARPFTAMRRVRRMAEAVGDSPAHAFRPRPGDRALTLDLGHTRHWILRI